MEVLLFSEAEGLLTKHLGPEAVHLGANARSFRKEPARRMSAAVDSIALSAIG